MTELTITQLRNLDRGDSSLLLAVDGEKETFNLSFNTLYQYIQERLGFLETGCAEMFLGEVVPETHTELDGKSFDPLVFPKMGALFPSGVLPDTRGMILKHAIAGREVLSYEQDSVRSHKHEGLYFNVDGSIRFVTNVTNNPEGALSAEMGGQLDLPSGSSSWRDSTLKLLIDNSSGYTGNHGTQENTVKNIAVKFIIKKA